MPALQLAIVIPTYNERENIALLISRLSQVLTSVTWEIIVVDDDSSDGTDCTVEQLACVDSRVRIIRRVGRRGLASACIEGILATCASFVLVMDGDLQHDESIIPLMYAKMITHRVDIVVATRNAVGGSMDGALGRFRLLLSKCGRALSYSVCGRCMSDPMSGFFLVRRTYFLNGVGHMHGGGFKILLDIVASNPCPAVISEVPFSFKQRINGTSKFDAHVGLEYLGLIMSKRTHGLLSTSFVLFATIGFLGVCTHLLILLGTYKALHLPFVSSQLIATLAGITANFLMNNIVLGRRDRLRGQQMYIGLITFWFGCSFGAWSNVIVARALVDTGYLWWTAGLAGSLVSLA